MEIKSICIITSPFSSIPPYSIGAVEKRWKSGGDYYVEKGLSVVHVCKRPNEKVANDASHIYIRGYERTGSWIKNFFFDLFYSIKALRQSPESDVLVLNTIWTPILLPLFKRKFGVSIYNVARFPKHQFRLYRNVDALSCVSAAVYNSLLEQTPSAKKQACMISNFIDIDVFYPRRKHCSSTSPVIVYSGRVHREKGIDLLVKAVRELRRNYLVTLKIIGGWQTKDGGSGLEYKSELESYAEGGMIEWVEPIYSPVKLAEEMDKGDIYCYPSLADNGETFGVAPLEAMGLGMPTIVSALDCFKDFIQDRKNGLIFDHHAPDAVSQLVRCIKSLVTNQQLYESISTQAANTARTFNIGAKAEEYLTLFNNLYRHHCTGFDEREMSVKKIK